MGECIDSGGVYEGVNVLQHEKDFAYQVKDDRFLDFLQDFVS